MYDKLTNLGKYSVSLLAVFSISSAYLFGLISVFPPGLRTLIDTRFYTNELLAFGLFVAGFSAAVRLQISVAQTMLSRIFKFQKSYEKDSKFYKRGTRMAVVILLMSTFAVCTLGMIAASELFYPAFLVIWLGAFLIFAVFCSILFLSTRYPGALSTAWTKARHEFLAQPRGFLLHPVALSLILSSVLFFSYTLGAVRIRSLAMADPLCIVLADRTLEAKILGETSSGIFAKVGEFEFGKSPFNYLMRFRAPGHEIKFISREKIILVESTCEG